MKRIAIMGAESPEAGELIRILINHPDVELAQVVSDSRAGLPVVSVHHGLIGEYDNSFQSALDVKNTDAVVAVGEMPDIDYTNGPITVWLPAIGQARTSLPKGMVYGQPEANRKPLVRGARAALVPSPVASVFIASMLPLLPLLPGTGAISVEVSASDLALKQMGDMESVAAEIIALLKSFRPEVGYSISFGKRAINSDRGMRLRILLPITMGDHEAKEAFENMYDDHNFSFVVSEPVETCEVEGTEKCLIALRSVADGLQIDSVADMRMRGGAGEAVHLLNLLFGLQERTGLMLKSTIY